MMAAKIAPLAAPIESLEDLLLIGMEMRLCISVVGGRWEIQTQNRGRAYIGIGDTREEAAAALIRNLGIELTLDDPYKRVVRWGKPSKAYGRNVYLEGISWAGCSEIRGWRYA
jgi:hypothetical protein